MIDRGKHNLLGVLVNAVDYDAATDRILTAAKQGVRCTCTALAVHGIMTGVQDISHNHRLNRFDMVVPDGQPVRWGLNLLYGLGLPDRVYGPNLMLECCRAAMSEDLPIYLYGSSERVNAQLVTNLGRMFPTLNIAGSEPSKFRPVSKAEKTDIIKRILDSGAKLTFVGLGCPLQEIWAYEYGDELNMPVLAIGAAFDFHSGNKPQAPLLLQRLGLEWLYRLSQEPLRLWKRYVLLNPAYLFLLSLQKLQLRSFDPESTTPPRQDLRPG